MLPKRQFSIAILILALVAIAGVACGSDDGAGANTGTVGATSTPVANSGDGSPVAAAAGGLDETCVQLVLGRTVTGFADITDAERTRVFAECSTGAAGGPRGAGEGNGLRGVGFDPACVQEATGSEETDIAALTAEQRTAVFAACGGADFAGGLPGGGFQLGGQGAGGFGAQFDSECVQNALGHAVDDITQLAQEELQTLFTQCAPEGFTPGGAFGQGGGRFGGGGANGAFGGTPVVPTN